MRERIAGTLTPSRPVRTGPTLKREEALWRLGITPLAGIDEAGRGPLAGPVVAAAVVLDPARVPKGLNDFKLLAKAVREALFDDILATAAVSIASIPASTIDRINIRQATLLAMARAVEGLSCKPAFAFVDGRDLPVLPCAGEAVIGGDRLITSVAAASIVAKVTRDRMMARLGLHFPVYGFADHAGYATAQHRKAIRDNGPCPFHRMSFSPFRIDENATP